MSSSQERRVRQRTHPSEGGVSDVCDAVSEGDEVTEVSLALDCTSALSALFDDPALSDVALVVGAERRTFRCHKVVLAAMSTYFR